MIPLRDSHSSAIAVASQVGGIAFFAHAGGFAFGWVVGNMLKSS